MLTCELMRKCEILVIMKCNKSGKGRSMLNGGKNSPVCVLFSGFLYSKVCLAAVNTLQREVDRHSGFAVAEKDNGGTLGPIRRVRYKIFFTPSTRGRKASLEIVFSSSLSLEPPGAHHGPGIMRQSFPISLRRDRYHGRRPPVTDQEGYRQIRCGGVLGVIEGPMQQKYDH
ncbi:hypothetical protein HAX54_051589 [Datura stramonium]|uniref:Uncharacterized protein n=1 Tax=Datura stramonium TaxID=4076 RepID=A0ABS8SZL6_DATST|nr:hypothetical protein [Datura stramonium]